MLQYFCSVSKVHIGKGTWWLPTCIHRVCFLFGSHHVCQGPCHCSGYIASLDLSLFMMRFLLLLWILVSPLRDFPLLCSGQFSVFRICVVSQVYTCFTNASFSILRSCPGYLSCTGIYTIGAASI